MKWRAVLEVSGPVYMRTCQWIKPDGKPQSEHRISINMNDVFAYRRATRSVLNAAARA
jgi:hypothetical protein